MLEPRHASFACADYVRLARAYGVGTVFIDSPDYPNIADVTGEVVYARLMRSQGDEPTGYSAAELARWAARIRTWARGESPADLPLIDTPAPAAQPREVVVYFIAAAKARNPAAAQALVARLNAS